MPYFPMRKRCDRRNLQYLYGYGDTLYSLVNQKVVITTPVVEITNWDKLTAEYAKPCVFINILYKDGIDGNNVLILKEDDVKVITDLMMGGDGLNPAPELTELHFSAICEAMNQMMGSSATFIIFDAEL